MATQDIGAIQANSPLDIGALQAGFLGSLSAQSTVAGTGTVRRWEKIFSIRQNYETGRDPSFRDVTCESLIATDLTSGRVTLSGVSGLLGDSSSLTFDGTTLTIGGITIGSNTITATGIKDLLLRAGEDIDLRADDDIDMAAEDDIVMTAGGIITLIPSGNINDYIQISTTSNIPKITTIGDCNLKITASSGTVDFETTDLITSGLGTFGSLLIDNITIDNDNISTSEDNPLTITTSGTASLTLTSAGSAVHIVGAASINLTSNDEIDFSASGDTDDYIRMLTTSHVPRITTVGSCDLRIEPDGGTVDFVGSDLTTTGQIGIGTPSNMLAPLNITGDTADIEDRHEGLWMRVKEGAWIVQLNVRGPRLEIGGGATLDATPAMSVNYNTGKVGIGTTTPGYILDIDAGEIGDNNYDGLRIVDTGWKAVSHPMLEFYNSHASFNGSLARIYGEIGTVGANSKLYFAVADSSKNLQDRMVIDKDGNVGIGTISPTIPLSTKEKCGMTTIGGYAIKLTNKTGGNTVAGQLVEAYSATAIDDAFKATVTNSDATIGVTLDAGVADGSEAWVVVSGIADVLMDGGGSGRGDRIISSSVAGSADVWNVGGAVATHFLEIGHCIETRTGAGLARCVIHFN